MSYASYKNIGVENNEDNINPELLNSIIEIESLEHRMYHIENYPIVIIDNYTSWCGPCKQIAPKFAKLGNKYQSKGVLCMKEDADKKIGNHPVKLRGVPCFHFYVNGKFISDYTITGADINQVEDKILQILN
jgi:thioredoxin 1